MKTLMKLFGLLFLLPGIWGYVTSWAITQTEFLGLQILAFVIPMALLGSIMGSIEGAQRGARSGALRSTAYVFAQLGGAIFFTGVFIDFEEMKNALVVAVPFIGIALILALVAKFTRFGQVVPAQAQAQPAPQAATLAAPRTWLRRPNWTRMSTWRWLTDERKGGYTSLLFGLITGIVAAGAIWLLSPIHSWLGMGVAGLLCLVTVVQAWRLSTRAYYDNLLAVGHCMIFGGSAVLSLVVYKAVFAGRMPTFSWISLVLVSVGLAGLVLVWWVGRPYSAPVLRDTEAETEVEEAEVEAEDVTVLDGDSPADAEADDASGPDPVEPAPSEDADETRLG